ncbi:MAG TPA: hypothetical protein VIY48_07575 [Candidatus Paceibacterota bacterium]
MASQLWATNSLGGYFYSLNLSEELRETLQPLTKFRQFSDVRDASQQGKKHGNTFTWDIVSNVVTSGGTVVETNTVPETNFTITQGTLTVVEYANSVPYSGKLDALSQWDVKRPVMQALKNDAVKTFDRAVHTQFNNTLLRVVPGGGTSTTSLTLTTNGTATTTNSIAYNTSHHKLLIDLMKERNIPPYLGDDYMAIAWPSTFRTLKNSIETLHQYTPPGLGLIMAGEIGRYENTRFVEQSNILKGVNNDGTAWTNALSDWIYVFGEDTVMEGVVVPEEIRAKIPTDYGRSKGVAYYALMGWGLVQQSATDMRVVKWDSAA